MGITDCNFAEPPSDGNWLHSADLSLAERCRRLQALQQTCDRLLSQAPEQRPQTLKAFEMVTRHSRKVKSYLFDPPAMLALLPEVPEDVAAAVAAIRKPGWLDGALLETPSPAAVSVARNCLRMAHREGWVSTASVSEQARRLSATFYEKRSYGIHEILGALRALGLLIGTSDFGCSLSKELCSTCLPLAKHRVPSQPWTTYHPYATHVLCRTLPLPPGCAGSFLGKCGCNIQMLQAHFQKLASTTTVVETPQAKVSVRCFQGKGQFARSDQQFVELRLKWSRWEQREQARSAADEVGKLYDRLVQETIDSLSETRRRFLTERFLRRQDRAQARMDAGLKYHEERRAQREERSRVGSAWRGLELPPPGISRHLLHGRGNRKDVLQSRRRTAQRQKRCQLLRACEELGFFESPGSVSMWQQPMSLQRNLCSWPKTMARRLIRQLHSCASEDSAIAIERFYACRKSSDRLHQSPAHKEGARTRSVKRQKGKNRQCQRAAATVEAMC